MMQIASDPAGGIAPGGHAWVENVFAMGWVGPIFI